MMSSRLPASSRRIIDLRVLLLPFLPLLAAAVSVAGCSSGGGGGGSGSFRLVTAHLASGPELPSNEAFINDQLIFTFSAPVDPSTVHDDSIQIRSEAGGFSIPAVGQFAVSENQVRFVPKLPTTFDLTDAGFRFNTLYRIRILGPGPSGMRTLNGRSLPEEEILFFSTRASGSLLRDPVEGPPRVVGFALDLDQDGVLESDGDLLTPDDEEFSELDPMPLLSDVPIGLARAPMRFGFLLSEPVFGPSVLDDEDGDGSADSMRIVEASSLRRLPFRAELRQGFNPDTRRFFSLVEVTPRTSLPGQALVEASISARVFDFADPPFLLAPRTVTLETRGGPARFEDALIEDFDDRRDLDPRTTAEWDILDSDRLTAGKGIGGTGVDGPFVLGPDRRVVLDTDANGGVYQFTDVVISSTSLVLVEGSNPLRLFATGDVEIAGLILAEGGDGEEGTTLRADVVVQGGVPGPGGGRGGRGNSFIAPNQAESGQGPAGTDGGGEGGSRSPTLPGGGGGGGHARVGCTDPSGIFTSGAGGKAYGDPNITTLFGGSGGGGGGSWAAANRRGDNLGGGGGGGGGAILISTAGSFFLRGGRVSVNGGDGGDGGRPGAAVDVGGGGGGGGSGGSIKIEALRSGEIFSGGLNHFGGEGGRGGGRGARPGACGAKGRLRLLLLGADRSGSGVGKSTAISSYRDTGVVNPDYSFDGNDPLTGEAREGEAIRDIQFEAGVPDNASVFIFFQGAPATEDLNRPDTGRETEWTARIDDLDGFRFIRFRIEFDIGLEIETAARPVITSLTIPFVFEL